MAQNQSIIDLKSLKISSNLLKICQNASKTRVFFGLDFFDEKNDRKKTILGPLGVEPDLAGKRKALI